MTLSSRFTLRAGRSEKSRVLAEARGAEMMTTKVAKENFMVDVGVCVFVVSWLT